MAALAGVVLPNRQWEPWTPDEVNGLFDLAPPVVIVLAYQIDTLGSIGHRLTLQEYVRQHPKARVIYRPYGDAIPTQDPVQWAEECRRRYVWFGVPGEICPANEMNLLSERGNENWDEHCDWLEKLAFAWRRLSDAKLHLPAVAPVGAYRDGLRRYRENGIHHLYDVADAHCYPGSFDDWRLVADLFGLPVTISEFNQTDPEAYLATLDDRVRDACWFILSGTADHRPYWLVGSSYYESMKRAAAAAPPPPAPPPSPPTDWSPPPADFATTKALRALADEPAGPEDYLSPNYALVGGRRHAVVYNARSGQVYVIGRELGEYLRDTHEPRLPPISRVARPARLALASGHHNAAGGDALEHELMHRLTRATAAACRARGITVLVIGEGEDDRDHRRPLRDVGRAVVAWSATGRVDLFIELHGQSALSAAERGCFAIYPEWMGGDVDAEVRDALGPWLARAIAQATGVPVWGDGVLSEQRTAVGLGGSRLAVFAATASIRASCTRLLIETGHLTNAEDLVLMRARDWPDRAAGAIAETLAGWINRQTIP